MRHAVALVIALVVAGAGGCAEPKHVEPTPATPADVVTAARGTLEQWRQAYEVRSFDALAKLYAHDKDLVVVQDGVPMIGWTSSVEAMLRDRLAKAKDVRVTLKQVAVSSVAPTVAVAVATMTREISDGVTTVKENGALTLVLRRTADGWVIVQEHYSYTRPS